MSLTAFSQKGINKKDSCVISLPCKVAYQIATDLTKGDSIAAELEYTQSKLILKDQKISIQDTIIKSYEVKEAAYKDELNYQKQQNDRYSVVVAGLEKRGRMLRLQRKVLGFVASVTATAALVEFLIIKTNE